MKLKKGGLTPSFFLLRGDDLGNSREEDIAPDKVGWG